MCVVVLNVPDLYGVRKFPYIIDYYTVGGLKRANSGEVKRKRGRPALVSNYYVLNKQLRLIL